MPKRCVICANNGKAPFHQYPANKQIAAEWRHILGVTGPYRKSQAVCSLHFPIRAYKFNSARLFEAARPSALWNNNANTLKISHTIHTEKRMINVLHKSIYNTKPPIHQLNMDCFLEILKFLDWKDHLNVLQACKHFEDLILFYWGKYLKEIKINTFLTPNLKADELKILFSNSCKTLKKLIITNMTIDVFNVIKEYNYPNVYDLRIVQEMYGEGYLYMGDIEFKILTEIFPNLRAVGVGAGFYTNKYKHWKHLEHVDIFGSTNFFSFQSMIRCHPLKSLSIKLNEKQFNLNNIAPPMELEPELFYDLEKLTVDGVAANWLCSNNLNHFKKLKEITVTSIPYIETFEDLYKNLIANKKNDIIELYTRQLKAFPEFQNLRDLTFHNITINDAIPTLPALRSLNFFYCEMKFGLSLYTILYNNRQITDLSIGRCTFNRNLGIYSNVEQAEPEDINLNTLTLNFFDNKIGNESMLMNVLRKLGFKVIMNNQDNPKAHIWQELKVIFK